MLEKYIDRYIDKKAIKFAKNVAISIPFMWAGGIAGTGLADIVTDSETYITAASMTGELICAIGIFLPLHYRDNKDKYLDKYTEKFKTKTFSLDVAKLIFTFGVADILYWIARPALNYCFLNEGGCPLIEGGYDPVTASSLSFWWAYPSHHLLKPFLAKITGVFNEDKEEDKEDNTH